MHSQVWGNFWQLKYLFSFNIRKLVFSFFQGIFVSSVVVCFLICSIKVNSAFAWKLCSVSLKCLQTNTDFSDLAFFLWFFRRMLKVVSLFSTYWNLHFQNIRDFDYYMWDHDHPFCSFWMRLFVLMVYIKDCLFNHERHNEHIPDCFWFSLLFSTTLLFKMWLFLVIWYKFVFLQFIFIHLFITYLYQRRCIGRTDFS